MRPLHLPVAIPEQLDFVEPVAAGRRMVATELMGSHSHNTLADIRVHVWKRGNKFLARGRYQGRPFGENLGNNELQAVVRLREILTLIDNGTYVRPSEKRKELIVRGRIARLTLRELAADFIAAKRSSRGRQTARDYAARLAPVLEFSEKSDNLKRWPLALDIDCEFGRTLRAFLFQYTSTRNGRPGAKPKPITARQIVNILECLRTTLHWARSAQVRKLPADWVMPLSPDLIGTPPAKNPLREDKLPLDARVQIVNAMDRSQLCQLALSMVLPLRPDEAAGLLISDLNFEKGWLEFSARLKDANFNKGKTAFYLPFPEELRPILRACIADRFEGPVLQSRRVLEGKKTVEGVSSMEHLVQLYEAELLNQPVGTIQAEHDRKLLFRALLSRLGGVSEDALNKEVKKLLTNVGIKNGSTMYTLRSSVTTAMHRANLPHLEMRYLTGHTTSDIMNEYTSLDPVGAMKRYFETIQPLLAAINERCRVLGISDTANPLKQVSYVEERRVASIETPHPDEGLHKAYFDDVFENLYWFGHWIKVNKPQSICLQFMFEKSKGANSPFSYSEKTIVNHVVDKVNADEGTTTFRKTKHIRDIFKLAGNVQPDFAITSLAYDALGWWDVPKSVMEKLYPLKHQAYPREKFVMIIDGVRC